ncbi:hypothetical protein ACP70R_014742 [Stipagrostis hirtigluma subsp. patula]
MDRPSKISAAAAASLSDLPDEAQLEILSRLPVKPLHRSKCVSKAWRDLIDDPLHRKKLPQTLEDFFDCVDGGHLSLVHMVERRFPLDIDPGFSFLRELPGIEKLYLQDSCNGLLLFKHVRESDPAPGWDYIVCNPAVKQWRVVPIYDLVMENVELVEEEEEGDITVTPLVDAYSSETGRWSHSKRDWSEEEQGQLEEWCRDGQEPFSMGSSSAFLNGMLHLLLTSEHQIVAVDLQGKTRRYIQLPKDEKDLNASFGYYIAMSQGKLHYIHKKNVFFGSEQSHQLFIWVLNDYDTQEWILKGTVGFLELFGEKTYRDGMSDLDVVSIHPDRNVVFFVHTWKKKLISYHLDHKEVSVVATLEDSYRTCILPYVPYFSVTGAHKYALKQKCVLQVGIRYRL